jgi:hypothetical protein
MPYLIDGDNLLGTWPGRRRSDAERRRLAFELDRFGRRLRRRVVVLFDGLAPPGQDLGHDVRFAGPGRSADGEILAWLRTQDDPRGWIVVTSDRSLGDQCRYLGARVERCHDFRPRLCAGGDDEKPEREGELDYWLRQFEPPDDSADP